MRQYREPELYVDAALLRDPNVALERLPELRRRTLDRVIADVVQESTA
jgi:hypothetical protein